MKTQNVAVEAENDEIIYLCPSFPFDPLEDGPVSYEQLQ